MNFAFRTMLVLMTLFSITVTAQDQFSGHLSFKQDLLQMEYHFPSVPSVGKKTTMIIETKDAQTLQTIDISDAIKVVLWMPSMGHGSAPTQVERAVDGNGNVIPGLFTVKNMNFVMGGQWEVRVILTDGQGTQETKSFFVNF